LQAAIALSSDISIHPPHDLWLLMGAVFLKLFLIVKFNCTAMEFFMADYQVEAMSMPKLPIGIGLFLATSLMNHSCNANVCQVTYGTSVVFRARRPIVKGEQITFCYKMPATRYSYEERQMTLLEDYNFKCR
jgi:hypothetical protein